MTRGIINIADYTYELPEERIARFPLPERDNSKLLVCRKGKIGSDVFKNISDYLEKGSLLVFNNSRVIPARMIFHKESGARIEIFLLEPLEPSDYQKVFNHPSPVKWKCLVGNLKKWKQEPLKKLIKTGTGEIELCAELSKNHGSWQSIRFSWNNQGVHFTELMNQFGTTPIPPYLNREPVESDKDRYQTVYSRFEGSVAAPTAGLHFTQDVFKKLAGKNIKMQEITLHVGAGTFQPVKTPNMTEHPMHTEHFVITTGLIDALIENKDPLVAVGTTTVRTLESIYWLGAKIIFGDIREDDALHVEQWDGYRELNTCNEDVLKALAGWMKSRGIESANASTSMMIVPGYKFRFTESMVTNFHQPRSTLLLLIAAFIGEKWKDVYNYAIKNNFRFLSYGDSSILIP
jgi:S-adenosylmethionine:tRNA ribosyltransferase-isomerase